MLKKDIQPKLVSHFCEKSQFLKLSHGGCIFYEELSANEKDNSSKGYLCWKTVCTVVTNSSCHAHNFWQRNYLPNWSILGRGERRGGGVDCISSRFVTFKNVRPRLGNSLKNPLNSRPRLPVELGVWNNKSFSSHCFPDWCLIYCSFVYLQDFLGVAKKSRLWGGFLIKLSLLRCRELHKKRDCKTHEIRL